MRFYPEEVPGPDGRDEARDQGEPRRRAGGWGIAAALRPTEAGGLPRRLRLLAMSIPSHAEALRGSQRSLILDIASPWRGNPTAQEPSELGGPRWQGDCRVA